MGKPSVKCHTVFELTAGEPAGIVEAPALPLDQVLVSTAVAALIENQVNNKFFDAIGSDIGPRAREVTGGEQGGVIVMEGTQETRVECGEGVVRIG